MVWWVLGCSGVALLALGVRAIGYFEVFPAGGDVVLSIADGAYHVRRALFSFERFPAALFFDPLLNHPDGAPVPMPPLYDWVLGGVARLLTDTREGFDRIAAWVSPVLAALTVFPIAAIGRSLRGWRTGLVAAVIFALLPIHGNFSRLGEPDHHAAVCLIGACWLWAMLGVLGSPRLVRSRWLHAALALSRAAMLLTWSGSLLYVVLFDGVLLGIAVIAGRREVLLAQVAGILATLIAVAPIVWIAGTPLDGPLTATTLSWLHLIVLAAIAVLAAGFAYTEKRRPGAGPGGRLLRALGMALLIAAPLLLLAPVRSALAPGVGFVARDDGWGAGSIEQRALFSRGAVARRAPRDATQLYGGFAFLIPLAGVGALLCARRRASKQSPAGGAAPEPAVALALLAFALGALALLQVRFGNDFLPAGALGFALLGAALTDFLGPRLGSATRARGLLAVVLLGLLWPPLVREHLPALRRARAIADLPAHSRLPQSPIASLHAFARLIDATTPATRGFLEPDARPDYGVMCPPNFGHVMHGSARRATPADNFGPYLDPDKLAAVARFYATKDEAVAHDLARELDTPYVMTAVLPGAGPERWVQRLHRDAGSGAPGVAHAERFRWIAVGPPGGRPLRMMAPGWTPQDGPPYRLFEVVEGAVLEVSAEPGTPILATLTLQTDAGVQHAWQAHGVAGADAVARVRVPYPTRSLTPVRAVGPYRVEVGDAVHHALVSESAVRSGERIALQPPPPG